mgnify:FL=1
MRLHQPRGLHLWLGSWCRHCYTHGHNYATRAFGSLVWPYAWPTMPRRVFGHPFRADLHGTIFVACDNGLRQGHDMIR